MNEREMVGARCQRQRRLLIGMPALERKGRQSSSTPSMVGACDARAAVETPNGRKRATTHHLKEINAKVALQSAWNGTLLGLQAAIAGTERGPVHAGVDRV